MSHSAYPVFSKDAAAQRPFDGCIQNTSVVFDCTDGSLRTITSLSADGKSYYSDARVYPLRRIDDLIILEDRKGLRSWEKIVASKAYSSLTSTQRQDLEKAYSRLQSKKAYAAPYEPPPQMRGSSRGPVGAG